MSGFRWTHGQAGVAATQRQAGPNSSLFKVAAEFLADDPQP